MSLSFVAFASCSDDKDNPVNNENTRTENSNGGNGSNTGSNGDNSGNTSGDSNGNVSAVSVFKSGTQDGHDYVDLGLTSGTMWATANVGAKTPQDYGNYYAWGETTTKETYRWSTYKYGTYDYDHDYSKLTKYNKSDNKTTLDLEDDAAYVNWGGKWRMPTRTQQDELYNQCYWVGTNSYNNSNVKGYIVYKAKNSDDKGKVISEFAIRERGIMPSSDYSLSDAHIFLPAAGYRTDDLYAAGGFGFFWSSSLVTDRPNHAWYVYTHLEWVGNDTYDYYYFGRYYGNSVRAVIPGNK